MFGVPEAHEDDALRACRAALEIQAARRRVEREYEQPSRPGSRSESASTRGEVVTGAVGRGGMFAGADAVVLGDAVNVAARLEQAAQPGEVLIGESTYRLVREAFAVEAVGPVEAKGKSAPVVAYRLLGVSAPGPLAARVAAPLAGRERGACPARAEFHAVGRAVVPARDPRRRARRREVEARGRAGRADRAAARAVARRVPLLRRGHHLLGGRPDRARPRGHP